jgi:hypothetical protein
MCRSRHPPHNSEYCITVHPAPRNGVYIFHCWGIISSRVFVCSRCALGLFRWVYPSHVDIDTRSGLPFSTKIVKVTLCARTVKLTSYSAAHAVSLSSSITVVFQVWAERYMVQPCIGVALYQIDAPDLVGYLEDSETRAVRQVGASLVRRNTELI